MHTTLINCLEKRENLKERAPEPNLLQGKNRESVRLEKKIVARVFIERGYRYSVFQAEVEAKGYLITVYF